MAARLLTEAGKKLLHLPSSSGDIINALLQVEQILSSVKQPPSKSMIKALHPISNALIARELLRHPDINVNISVECCICQILRIMVPDPPYKHKQIKNLHRISLKWQYLRLRNYLLHLVDTLIASPVCWQFGEKILKICAAKLKPHLLDMSIAIYDCPKMVAHICKTASPMEVDDTISCTTEANIDMVQTLRDCQDASTSITKMKVKRKRDNEQAQPVEDGEILVGRRIKVWCSKDENYRPGVVKLFDPIYKMHMLEQGLPNNVSSPQTDAICVEGYKVKNINAPILEAIFKKHGDIAAECVFKTPCVRESFLEVICEVVKRIETNDVRTVISKLEEIDCQVSEAQAAKINVSWLQPHLEAIQKRNKAERKSSLLMEMKVNTILVKRAAQTDLIEKSMELVAAQKRFENAERCVNVLDLVENKLNDNILESKAEKDSWVKQPIL
ncbi:phospholipase-like protein [Artemisia annua]|uniref:Phospholipase-like protein n=1 Tax=Artemisia annua TaxID=35608 RepID=A0A2U1Q0C9_ARTAN|nr:phospholipase-like protein [Artemisia annua]